MLVDNLNFNHYLPSVADLPNCRNKLCEHFNRNTHMYLLADTSDHWLFGCGACKGIEYRTKPVGWVRAAQERSYQSKGRPEYAKVKQVFGFGKNRT